MIFPEKFRSPLISRAHKGFEVPMPTKLLDVIISCKLDVLEHPNTKDWLELPVKSTKSLLLAPRMIQLLHAARPNDPLLDAISL